jgi:predicted Zn-dependent protease
MNANRLSLALVVAFVASAIVSWFCVHFSDLSDRTRTNVAAVRAPQRLAYSPPNTGGANPSGDYLNVIAAEGAYVWASNRLPLTVFISDGSAVRGYQPQFRGLIAKAFDEWCRASNGRLSWRQVNSRQQAAIVVGWTDRTKSMGAGFEAGETRTTTVTSRYGGTSIESAQITILTNMMGRPFAQSELYKTCLHEVGHALGLQGHSHTQGDIMYPSLNPRQVPYLTARDSNTIQLLYRGYREAPPTVAQSSADEMDLPPGASGSEDGIQPFTEDDGPGYGRQSFPQEEMDSDFEPPQQRGQGYPYRGQSPPQGMMPPQMMAPQPRYVNPQSAMLKQFAWQLGQQMLRQAVGRYGF